jgi:Zn-dependent peptidase ImmA (M78 family)
MFYETLKKPRKMKTDLLDKAVVFACDYLELDLDLIVEFENLKENKFGYCDYDEDEVIVTISKNLSVEDMIRTFFHEMVHVHQYDSGKLENGKNQRWFGVEYDCEYEELPWEVEAFEVEQKMMEAFYAN